jgi:outer membrane cobalamin receptor
MTPIRRDPVFACRCSRLFRRSLKNQPVGMAPDVVVTADRYIRPIRQGHRQRHRDHERGDAAPTALRTVADVLRSVPGVSVQQSGGPGATSVFVRGSNSTTRWC